MDSAWQLAVQQFGELYSEAFRREHPAIVSYQLLSQAQLVVSPPAGIQLAQELTELRREFTEDVVGAAKHSRMRIYPVDFRCPACGGTNCLTGWATQQKQF